jgi:hypothetical protein
VTDDLHALANLLAWLGISTCLCAWHYVGMGRVHGVSMGKGWVRIDTVPTCPHHGDVNISQAIDGGKIF